MSKTGKLIPLPEGVKYELRMFVKPIQETTPAGKKVGMAAAIIPKDKSLLVTDPNTSNRPFKTKEIELKNVNSLSVFGMSARILYKSVH